MVVHIIAKILMLPLLLYISAYDRKHSKIPNAIHPILLCCAIFLNDISPFSRLLGAVVVAAPLFIYSLKTKRLGMGDVKLIFCIGWCIGLLSLFSVSIAYLLFIIITHKQGNEKIPFAPYLCGSFAVFLFLPYFLYGG